MSKSVERERKASGEREPRRTGGYRGSTVELAEVIERVDRFGKQMDELAEQMTTLTGLCTDHRRDFDRFVSQTSYRLDESERRINGVQDAVSTLYGKTSGMSRRVDDLDSALVGRAEHVDDPKPVAKATEPEKPEQLHAVRPGSMFTGKAYVFFIHDKDGNVIWDWPFYQPSAAKFYDWNYKMVPSWVENGEFARVLEPAEAARMRW